jgi:prepilin-type processing-associated H-X9-DG protein
MAWIAYADDHDGKLVCGDAFDVTVGGYLKGSERRLEGWLGRAFFFPESRSAVIENPDKGALWRYVQDIDVYRCPRGWTGHAATYAMVSAANTHDVEGTLLSGERDPVDLTKFGQRVGDTVLKLTRLTEIVSPGAAARAVFVDRGQTPVNDFYVYYLYDKWQQSSPPPIHHADGATLSMADGHAEYWKWRGRETVSMRRELKPAINGLFLDRLLNGKDYEPKTEDGLYDLERLQRATWGRLGYSLGEPP